MDVSGTTQSRGGIRELLNRPTQASGSIQTGVRSPHVMSAQARSSTIAASRSISDELQERFRGGTRFRDTHRRSTSRQRSLATQSATMGKPYTRNIFLVPECMSAVPKGYDKQRMYEEGMVMNFVQLYTGWEEEKLETIKSLFSHTFSEGAE